MIVHGGGCLVVFNAVALAIPDGVNVGMVLLGARVTHQLRRHLIAKTLSNFSTLRRSTTPLRFGIRGRG